MRASWFQVQPTLNLGNSGSQTILQFSNSGTCVCRRDSSRDGLSPLTSTPATLLSSIVSACTFLEYLI